MIDDLFRRRIHAGEVLLGIFAAIPNCEVVEIIGGTGFDFVVLDGEHGPMALKLLEEMVRSAEVSKMASLIRVADNRPVLIASALDRGANGVPIPHISNAEAAEAAVWAAKFTPEGGRGLNPFVRAGDYFTVPTAEFCARSNEAVVVALQVEGREGVKNLESIVAVPGFDIVFVGPFDLSQSLGVPGEVRHPDVVQAVRDAVDMAGHHGKVVGTYANAIEDARFWVQQGVRVMFYQTDTGLLSSACDAARRELGELQIRVE